MPQVHTLPLVSLVPGTTAVVSFIRNWNMLSKLSLRAL